MPDTRIAAITGGARGMGRETAGWLARAGMTVAVLDLEAKSAAAATTTLPGKGHVGYALDVSNEAAVVTVFNRIESEIGPVAVSSSVLRSLISAIVGAVFPAVLPRLNAMTLPTQTGLFPLAVAAPVKGAVNVLLHIEAKFARST